MNSSQFKGSLLAASEWTQYSIYEEAHKEDLCLSRGRPQSWDPGTHLAKTKHCILQECQQETLRGLLHLKHVVLISGFGDSFMIVLWEYVIQSGLVCLLHSKLYLMQQSQLFNVESGEVNTRVLKAHTRDITAIQLLLWMGSYTFCGKILKSQP